MDQAEYNGRVATIQGIRHELALVCRDVWDDETGTLDAHGAWHLLRPFLCGRDVEAWADEIEWMLLPQIRAHGDASWQRLTFYLSLLIQELRMLDPVPRYGCPRCH